MSGRREQFFGAAWLAVNLAVPVAGCGGIPQLASPQPAAEAAQDTLPPVVLEKPQEGKALVYLFNASGWTLFGGTTYTITLDGQSLAHLPRGTYTSVNVAPGPHKMEAAESKLEVNFEPGGTYFVAVAYNPGKSWAWPFAGKAFEFQQVDERTAQVMLRQFRYQAQDAAVALFSDQD